MNELRLTKCLLAVLLVISTTMFVWTINYINTANQDYIPSAISAFNG